MSDQSFRTGGDRAAVEFAKMWAGDVRDRRRAEAWDGRFRRLAYLIPGAIIAALVAFLASGAFAEGYAELQALSASFG